MCLSPTAEALTGVVGGPAASGVSIPLPDPDFDAFEPTLLRFLRLRGVDIVVGPDVVELERCPETAFVLAEYVKFLRLRLEVIAENIANASSLKREDGVAGPYRRKTVILNERGQAEVVEDLSPWRVVRSGGSCGLVGPASQESIESASRGGVPVATTGSYVIYPNVDVDLEMARADEVSREYRAVRGALQAMGVDAVPALVAMLREGPPQVRADAAYALGEIGQEACGAVPELIQTLDAEDWESRRAAASAVQRIAPHSEVVTEAVVGMWLRALASEAARQRHHAAVALGRMGSKAQAAVPALAERVTDPTSGAARALGDIGEAAAPAVPNLVEALSHPQVHVRAQAADALGRIGSPARSAVPALVQAMSDANPEVRWRAAAAIGMIGVNDSGCIAALAELLRDEDASVRQRVAESLERLGAPAAHVREALAQAARGGPREHAWLPSVLAVSKGRTFASAYWLAATLWKEDKAVRLMICKALSRFGPLARPAVPLLVNMLEEADGAIAAAVMDALGALGPVASDAVPALSLALGDRSARIRRHAAETLGRIGPAAAAAVPALIGRLADSSEPVMLAAVKALGRIGPKASQAAASLRLLQGDSRASIQKAARLSLARIVEPDAGDRPMSQDRYRAVADTASEDGEL